MKKSSLITKASSRRTSRNRVFTRVLLSGLVVFLLVVFVPRVLSFVANVVVMPIHVTESWLMNSKDSLPYFFRDRNSLVNEIHRLKSVPPEGVGDKLTIARLTKENNELRGLLNDNTADRIVAGVIGRPNVIPYDVLMIDQGSDDGIKIGAPVYIGGDTVVGVVKSTNRTSSLVELITSPSFEATVYIYGPDIYTTAVGIGGGVLRVGVPQGIELSEGDIVVLPSVESGVFGEIAVVESLPTQPEQYGFVTPATSLGSLRLVAVGSEPLSRTSFEDAMEMVEDTYNELFTVPVPEGVLIDINSTSTVSSTTIATSSIPENLAPEESEENDL